ncbi:MAG: hypothetical protein QXX01_03240 [Candidatus Aenigmatarchaeota archaeon]
MAPIGKDGTMNKKVKKEGKFPISSRRRNLKISNKRLILENLYAMIKSVLLAVI